MRLFLIGVVFFLLNPFISVIRSEEGTALPDQPVIADQEPDLYFIENLGQLGRKDIDVYIPGRTTVGIGSGLIQFTYLEDDQMLSTVRLELVGSSDVTPVLTDLSPEVHNYFLGNDPEEWVHGARSFSTIIYPEIYQGIDLKVYSVGSSLKYDLIVHPDGDPSDIHLFYNGADKVHPMGPGQIQITCGGLTLDEGPLYTYQEGYVESQYEIDDGLVSIEVPRYDRTRDLIIDPLLLASTYVGGNNWDRYPTVEMDDLDRPVIALSTDSTNMPTSTGSYSKVNKGDTDIYIARLSRDLSSLLSSTYFGGSTYDDFGGLAIGSDGRVYVSGGTNSTNLPVTPGAYKTTAPAGKNVFVACFEPDLSSLHYSTYIGGGLSDLSTGIDVDTDGAAYLTGITYSTDYPVSPSAFQTARKGFYDTFATKVLPDGSGLAYSTLIGGGGELWGERAETIKVDGSGHAIIAGMVINDDYPVTNGAFRTQFGHYMGFVTMFSADGSSLEFSTFFSNGTYINSLDLGPQNNIYLTGRTVSVAGDFTITKDAYDKDLSGKEDAFFSVLNHNGTKLLYSTFLGANEKYMDDDEFEELERAWDIRAGSDGRAFIVGETDSILFPITMGAFDSNLNDREGFITIFSPDWSDIEYSTFIGGRDQDTASGIALNASNGMYVCGDTYSNYPNHDFPVTDKAYDQSFSSGYDSYLIHFKLDSYPPGPPRDLSYASGDSYINISWTTPLSDGGEDITSYRIYRGTSASKLNYMDRVDPDIFNYNDTSAVNGRIYYYGIRAENVVSQGEWGTISAVASTKPGPPIIYRIVRSDSSLNVSWYRPADDGGISEIMYTVHMGETRGTLNIVAADLDREWYNITGLINGRSYFIGVSARNWRGEGPLSEVMEAVPQRPPSKPLELTASLSPFRIHLTWTPPVEDGGSENITYDVYLGRNLSAMEIVKSDLNTTWTEVQVSTIGIEMTVFVRASNELGPGERSDLLNITPLGDLSRPINLTASDGGDRINLSWEAPYYNGGARNLTYNIYSGWDLSNLTLVHPGVSGTVFTLTPVIQGKAYFFAVSANNSAWESKLSEIVTIKPYQVPTRPLNLAGTIGDKFVNLTWDQPTYFGGDDNVSYDLYMATGNGSFGYVRWLNSNQTMVRGLINGIDYSFYVRAYNVKGRSLRSNILTIRPLTYPSAPRNPYYYDDDSSLNITWDAPLDDGGTNLTRYNILMGPSDEELVPVAENLTGHFLLITGLNNGQLYFIRIVAVNEIGWSPPSDLLLATPMKLPSPPTNLNITWQEGGVLVKWDPPEDLGGGEVYYYHIYRGPDPGNMTKITTVSGSFLTYKDMDAIEGTTYYYKIVCVTTKGNSPPSEIFVLEPPKTETGSFDPTLYIIGGGAGLLAVLLLVIVLLVRRRNFSKDWPIEE